MDCVSERAGQGLDDTRQFQHGVAPPPASLQMAVAAAPAISISGLWEPESVTLIEDYFAAGVQLLAMLQGLGKQLATAALLVLMLGLQATAIIMPPAAGSHELVAIVWCAPGPQRDRSNVRAHTCDMLRSAAGQSNLHTAALAVLCISQYAEGVWTADGFMSAVGMSQK